MENQKQPKAPVPAPVPAPAPAAEPVKANPQNPANPFRGSECIILVLAPNKSVHPVINKPGSGQAGIRIFDTPELAALELTSNKILMSHPSAIVPLKEFFS